MKQPFEEKGSLIIDFREQRSGIICEIEKYTDKVSFEVATLATGDYQIGNKIIVERKTLSDFLTSIKSGRIFQQAYRMVQTGKNGLIILEGDKSMVDSGSMSREAVQGALIHLTVFLGIPVLRSLNIRETAAILVDIMYQCQRHKLPVIKPILAVSPGIRFNKRQKQKLQILQNLPGIGLKKALALLKSFSTIENIILNGSTANLTKVQGIGIKLAGRIFTIMHEPF
jgi:DNA excision repair protein ERCC-4